MNTYRVNGGTNAAQNLQARSPQDAAAEYVRILDRTPPHCYEVARGEPMTVSVMDADGQQTAWRVRGEIRVAYVPTLATAVPQASEPYWLFSVSQSDGSDLAVWWRNNFLGFTVDPSEAGEFGEDEARRVLERSPGYVHALARASIEAVLGGPRTPGQSISMAELQAAWDRIDRLTLN